MDRRNLILLAVTPFFSLTQPAYSQISELYSLESSGWKSRTYMLSDTNRRGDIGDVVKAVSSREPVGKGEYVNQFLRFLGHEHSRLQKLTYLQEFKSRLKLEGYQGYERAGIFVQIVEGMRNEEKAQSLISRYPNGDLILRFDDSLSPAEFYEHLNLGLEQAVKGGSVIGAYMRSHQGISAQVRDHPELIPENHFESPLTALMRRYAGRIVNIGHYVKLERDENALAYLVFLFQNKNKKIEELDGYFDSYPPEVDMWASRAAKRFLYSNPPHFFQTVFDNLSERTLTIIQQNRDFPAGKFKLIKDGIQKIRRNVTVASLDLV